MSDPRPLHRPLLASLLGIALLAACGGGGSDEDAPQGPAALEGTYQVVGQVLDDVTVEGTVETAEDGTAAHDIQVTGANGALLADFEPTLDPVSGDLAVDFVSSFAGGLGGGGALGVVANEVGERAGVLLLGRRGGGLRTVYNLVSLEHEGTEQRTSIGQLRFEATGEVTLLGRALNLDGGAGKELGPIDGTFQVGSEGDLEVQLDNGLVLTGALVVPGDVALLSLDVGDGRRGTFLLVAEAPASDAGTLSGPYRAAAFLPDGEDAPDTFLGDAAADGAGTLTLDLRDLGTGDLPASPDVVPYTLQANGQIAVEAGTDRILRGAVTADGRFAAVVSTAGFSPRLLVLVRR